MINKFAELASKDIDNGLDLINAINDFSKLSYKVQEFIIWNYVNSPNKYKFV